MEKPKKTSWTKILLFIFIIIMVFVSYFIVESLVNDRFMDHVFEKCPKTLTFEEMEECYIGLGMFFIIMQHISASLIFLLVFIIIILISKKIKAKHKHNIKPKT